jgi:hypothetical protein
MRLHLPGVCMRIQHVANRQLQEDAVYQTGYDELRKNVSAVVVQMEMD